LLVVCFGMFCASLKFGGNDNPTQHLVRVYAMLSGIALPLPSINARSYVMPVLLSRTRMTLPPTYICGPHIASTPQYNSATFHPKGHIRGRSTLLAIVCAPEYPSIPISRTFLSIIHIPIHTSRMVYTIVSVYMRYTSPPKLRKKSNLKYYLRVE